MDNGLIIEIDSQSYWQNENGAIQLVEVGGYHELWWKSMGLPEGILSNVTTRLRQLDRSILPLSSLCITSSITFRN